MALSEYEQRVLDEIEHTLRQDGPQLDSSPSAARQHYRWTPFSSLGGQLLADLSLLLTGLTVLLIGVHANSTVGIAVGLIGSGLVVVSVHATLTAVRRTRHHR
jgi:hypothetical protein